MEHRILIFIVLSFVFTAMSCFAQFNQGFDLLPDPDECETFTVTQPETFPIFRQDMPFEVGLAYSVIDTICKSLTYDEIEEGISQLSDDSLAIAYHIFQRASSYDPFLLLYLWRYSSHSSIPESYKSIWENVTGLLNHEYNKRFKGIDSFEGDQLSMDTLSVLCTLSYGIYLVRVLDTMQREYIDSSRGYPCTRTIHCADCEVLQIYQGQHYYSNCQPETYELGSGHGCIRYHWLTSCDSIYSMYPHYFRMQIGHDYLVFSRYGYESNAEYPDRRYSVAALRLFEVANGNLLNRYDFFGEDETIPYDTIESRLEAAINEIEGR